MTQFPLILAAFVTPAFFVAGILLAAIPIVIHILNRRRYKTVNWAAMEFLLRAMKKNRRRLRFEQWVLLATRCLVVFLLGMAAGETIRIGYQLLVDMTVITYFIPFVYLFGAAWKQGRKASAAMGTVSPKLRSAVPASICSSTSSASTPRRT